MKVTASITAGVGTTLQNGAGKGCGLAKDGMTRVGLVKDGAVKDGVVKVVMARDGMKSIGILVNVINVGDALCLAPEKEVSRTA